jgi:para-nitrobenzyl esterase
MGAPRARTGCGLLAGSWDGAVAVFRGIPYAAPPVGAARWQPPQPPRPWEGTRQATEFGPAPVQPQPPRRSIMYQANFADRHSLVMSEDCLYLNVWTPDPAPDAGLPVLVWVHGGGNRYGHGGQDVHDGRNLARRGVVVVTLNHRLGALGFLSYPGLSGNYGMLDVVAALDWVRQEIAAFGGDPARVTLAGNSAGAAQVCHVMAAPRARGLFSRAIGQSASGFARAEGRMRTLAEAEEVGMRFAKNLGAASLEQLRDLSPVELCTTGHFGPIVDGELLTEDTGDVFASGRQAGVPLLAGTNLDEGSHFVPAKAAAALADAAAGFPDGAAFDAVYPPGDVTSARRWTGDARFTWPVWRWASEHARVAPVWMYRFTRCPPLPADLELTPPVDGVPGYGVFHTAELPYLWDNLHVRPWPWQPVDHELATRMADVWVRFAADGGDLPWAPFPLEVMHFGDEVRAGPPDHLAAMRLHDAGAKES